MNSVLVSDESFGGALDTAVSHALLRSVAAEEIGTFFRLFRPDRVVAFGRSDRMAKRYPTAVRASKAHGFVPVERLAGGNAAVFHHGTLAFSLAVAEPKPRVGIASRFELISTIIRDALVELGLDARVGEVDGEYCPGAWSVNISGRTKVMGVGQRLVRGAAHIGGVIVVDDPETIRDVLIPVYRALAIDWDPRTTGALSDRAAELTTDIVSRAVLRQFSHHFEVISSDLPPDVVTLGRDLVQETPAPGRLKCWCR